MRLTFAAAVAAACCAYTVSALSPKQALFLLECCVDSPTPCEPAFCAKHVEDVRKLAALPADADEDPKVVRIRHSKGESHGMVTRFLKARFRMRKGTDAVTRFADSNAHGLRHNSPRSDTPAVTRLSMDGVEELEDDHTIMDRFMSMRADAVTHAFVGHAAGLPVVSAVWPNARVPYTFSKAVAGPRKDGVGASRRYRLFSKAIQHIQKKTCVTFDFQDRRPRRGIKLQEGTSGDFSNGLGTAATTVELDATTTDLDTAIHELMHVLGMGHTHERADRDTFVTVDKEKCREFFKTYCDNTAETVSHVNNARLVKAVSIYNRYGGINGKTSPPTLDTALEARLVQFQAAPSNGRWARLKATMTAKEQTRVSNDAILKMAHSLCFVGWWAQYKEVTGTSKSSYSGDSGVFDYASEMLYGFDDGEPENAQCMIPKTKPYTEAGSPVPGTSRMTDKDADAVNALYGCSGAKMRWSADAHEWKRTDKWAMMQLHPSWTVKGMLRRFRSIKPRFLVNSKKDAVYVCQNQLCTRKSDKVDRNAALDTLGDITNGFLIVKNGA